MAPSLQWRRGKAAPGEKLPSRKSTRRLAVIAASMTHEQDQRIQQSEDSMRPTDLTALDMRAVLEANVLCFDTQEGEFSGWIHVAEVPRAANDGSGGAADELSDATVRKSRQRLVFRRRFCRLRELMCAFYESDAPSCNPTDHHVIISVERVHERNKAFRFVDYEDRCILLYTTLGVDFEEWFGAFAYAVRKTQVSKARVDGRQDAPQSKPKPSHHRRHGAGTAGATGSSILPSTQRNQALTGDSLSKTSPQGPDVNGNDEPDERTQTAWLYLQCPWWKLHHRRRCSRRYFVLSGSILSCFGVNKEGQVSEFTTRVVSIKHDALKDPLAVKVLCEAGKTLRLSQKATKTRVMEDWVAHLQAALSSNSGLCE